jgi:hypothetical protein
MRVHTLIRLPHTLINMRKTPSSGAHCIIETAELLQPPINHFLLKSGAISMKKKPTPQPFFCWLYVWRGLLTDCASELLLI